MRGFNQSGELEKSTNQSYFHQFKAQIKMCRIAEIITLTARIPAVHVR